jgi:hypothetical protein
VVREKTDFNFVRITCATAREKFQPKERDCSGRFSLRAWPARDIISKTLKRFSPDKRMRERERETENVCVCVGRGSGKNEFSDVFLIFTLFCR